MTLATSTVAGRYGKYVVAETPFATGGTAALFNVDEAASARLLFKRFFEPLGSANTERIEELVEVGRELKSAGRVMGDVGRIAWPVDLAIERKHVTGVLIPRAGDDYFVNPDRGLARNFGHLASLGAPPIAQRLAVLRQLAGALALLDRHELVHGDVSATNLLWRPGQPPQLLLIDCDGLRLRSFPWPSYATDHWRDPRLEHGEIQYHDNSSDWYALSLAVYRAVVLNSRAAPRGAADIERLCQTFPQSLATPLADAFSSPLDTAARLPPRDWRILLGQVIKSGSDCHALDAIASDLPTSVAARRGIAAAKSPHLSHPGRHASSGRPSQNHAAVSKGAPGEAAAGNHRRKSWRLGPPLGWACVSVAIATLTLYHFTGLPNWRLLNTLNPFLSGAQRSLVSALPGGVKHCESASPLTAKGVLATVRCDWNGRELLASRFASVTALRSLYRHRRTLGARLMARHAAPSNCPRSGDYTFGSSPAKLGEVTAFVSSLGARLDWTRDSTRTYLIGLGRGDELASVCSWWARQSEP